MKNKSVIAFDIGGTGCQWIKFNGGKVEKRGDFSTKNLDKQDVLKNIAQVFLDNKEEGTVIGISSPTAVNTETGYCYGQSGIKNYENFNLYNELSKLIKEDISKIRACNDANAALLGTAYFDEDKNDNLVMVTLGTGVGGAIMLNNKLIVGRNGFGGEFGYSDIFQNGLNISRNISTIALINQIKADHGEDKNGKEIIEAYREGKYKETVDKWFVKVTSFLSTLVYFLNPDVIYIGGGISNNDFVIDKIKTLVLEELNKNGVDKINPKIRKSYSGGDSGIYGAYCLWN